MDEINLMNMVFKRSGKKYCVYDKSPYDKEYNKYVIKLTNMKCPFGVEKYNYKEIINFEFLGSKKNNQMLNQYSLIKQIDSFLRNIKEETLENYINYDMYDDINEKHYMSCLKEKRGFDPLIRVHLKKKAKNILTEVSKDGTYYDLNNIKGEMCNLTIEIGDIWINEYNYGLVLYVSEIEIIN